MDPIRIVSVRELKQIEIVRNLFWEYERYLNVDLCFQSFDKELAGLPGDYSPPSGRLLLAFVDNQPAGCIALRKSGDTACEMKRLYVKPAFRGRGFGRKLTEMMIGKARKIGYSKMRLDTLDKLHEAIQLYRSMGFRETEPYYDNPLKGVSYWEIGLVR